MQTSGATKFNAASPIPDINHFLKIVPSPCGPRSAEVRTAIPASRSAKNFAKRGLVIRQTMLPATTSCGLLFFTDRIVRARSPGCHGRAKRPLAAVS